MSSYPDILILDSCVAVQKISDLLKIYLEALIEGGFPAIRKWEILRSGEVIFCNANQNLEELFSRLESINDVDGVCLRLDQNVAIYINENQNQRCTWDCSVNFFFNNQEDIDFLSINLGQAVSLVRYFLRHTSLSSAVLWRQGGGANCIPSVPIVGRKTHLVLTTELEVNQSYEYPQVFWQAGWETIEQYGDQFLLLRGMNTSDDISFLSEILPHQWNMARAAKPGLTKYFRPKPTAEEMQIFKADDPYLNIVGYVEAESLVEYACYLEPNEHIRGWEIYELWELINVGSLADGNKVDLVRVVFFNEEMAQREKRPLLDIGAKVYHYNPEGELVEVIA